MAKKRSASSPRAKLVSVSAESIFSKPVGKAQKAVLNRIARSQAAGDDASIDFSDIPELTAAQLRKARRVPKVLVAARIDRDVYDWLQGHGEGYSTRINAILRAVMSTGKRIA
ncbi:MAG TPA: cytoplasmic protein [Solibacterales bacterium]|nr:cytoplasmic protein [Bryobacterales bacterium]